MTTVCGGGTSSAQPALAATVYVAPAAIGALLNNIPTPWAVGFAGLLGLLTYDLSIFCTVDPPAVPTFDIADYALLASPIPLPGSDVALGKLRDLIDAFLWYQFCKCDSVETPAPPSPPGAPTGLVNPAPPIATQPASVCQHFAGANNGGWLSGSHFYTLVPNGIAIDTITLTGFPGGARSVALSTTVSAGGTAGSTYTTNIVFFGPGGVAGGSLGGNTYTTAPGATNTGAMAIPSGASQFYVYCTKILSGGGAATNTLSLTVDFYCDGSPGQLASPCCPPDPLLAGVLDQVHELVTLIQRQIAPFAYVYGSNHVGLVDSDELAVSGLIGVSVDVTTLPSSYGVNAGAPDELFNLGYVTLGTDDGWTTSRRIDHDGTLLLPQASGVFTRIGYTLSPGVEVSIRELLREP